MRCAGLTMVLWAGCAAAPPPVSVAVTAPRSSPEPHAAHDAEVASNILRGDYAGSAACQRCHPTIYDEWRRSPMHRMTRPVDDTDVAAPFAGETFTFKHDALTMETHHGARFMRLSSTESGGRTTHLYRVRKIIGGHHREDFTGVEVADVDAPPLPSAREQVLPATFQLVDHTWRYKGYSVMTPERPSLKAGAVWSQTCIFCHNTEPLLSTLLGALAGPSAGGYQGELVDPLLPAARRVALAVTDAAGLTAAVTDEMKAEGAQLAAAPLPALLANAVRATRVHFGEAQLVELGIGCESCHGGAREHVEHSSVLPSLLLRSRFLTARPDGNHAQAINRVCARCHQVLFSHYAPTWEGGQRNRDPGGSSINSGEARDFLLGHCAAELSCVACHSPHAPDNASRMAALDANTDGAGNAVCLSCHTRYAGAALTAHTHHAASSTGSQCLSCHMPKKNMSLDHRLTRYHRIGSPNDAQRAERDRPLECALCHADRTVGQLADTMDAWWGAERGRPLDRAALTALYGRLDALPLPFTVEHGKPHEQAVALAVLAERGKKDRAVAALAAAQLTHALPIVRYYAVQALARALGHAAPIDLFADDGAIAAAADALLRKEGWAAAPRPAASAADAVDGDGDGDKAE